jgi:hypothetical protein
LGRALRVGGGGFRLCKGWGSKYSGKTGCHFADELAS